MSNINQRFFRYFLVIAISFVVFVDAHAQFDKLRKKIPGMSGNSELETVINQIDSARVKSAYARITLSLADDVIRRQALRNTAKKSTQSQIEKDQKEIEALDRSIAEKRKLLAELGRQTGSGKYDEQTSGDVDKQLKGDEQQRAEKRAMVDQEIADQQRNEKDLSDKDRENYGKLARLLYTAGRQEQYAIESAKELKPRAESAARNSSNSPTSLLSTQPKRLNEGMKGLNEILTEGPQHLATITTVANHLAKIGGVDLTDPKFESKVVTDEDQIPTDW
jgi:septal ring factor EnvC (AmiA/AmiB activator)